MERILNYALGIYWYPGGKVSDLALLPSHRISPWTTMLVIFGCHSCSALFTAFAISSADIPLVSDTRCSKTPEPPPSLVPDAKTMISGRIDDSVYIGMMPFMRKFGPPLKRSAIKILLLGSGELGREVAIEAMRLGVEVIACDRYKNAPAMQMAHRNYTFNMREGKNIRKIVEKEKPDFIVPEIEAIATDTLVELEKEGWTVIPRAIATKLTMDREGIRRLSAEKLKLPTSPYHFASSLKELEKGALDVGFPCVIKPTMSSSGHGQSVARKSADLKKAWHFAMTDTRVKTGRVIVEGFIDFDYEITLLTVRHAKGIS